MEQNTISGRDMHRISFICEACETVSHCMKCGCIPVSDSADPPPSTPEEAFGWLEFALSLIAGVLFIAVMALSAAYFAP
jgi:hypothetical protein